MFIYYKLEQKQENLQCETHQAYPTSELEYCGLYLTQIMCAWPREQPKVHRCPKNKKTLFTPGQQNTTMAY